MPRHLSRPSAPTGRQPDPHHGHGHAAGVSPPTTVRAARPLFAAAAVIVVLTVLGLVLLRPVGAQLTGGPDRGERVQATVTATAACGPASGGDLAVGEECVLLTLNLENGPEAGAALQLRNDPEIKRQVAVGDRLVLVRAGEVGLALVDRYQIVDVERSRSLLVLGVLFAVAVLALGRWRGALALVGLGASLLVVVGWLVPALLSGRPPLLTATVGASAVMLVALALSHGVSLRTTVALLGTASSLLLILAMSTVAVQAASLTGLTSEEAQYVRIYFADIDLRGLLLAGVVIGALGILDDVTVTQVSTVWELRRASPTMPGPALFAAGLRVGRDHIASTVNTLLLAYAGASLPLLVIFSTSGQSLGASLTSGVVAQELVRTLVGSIGLVAAVPVTTALAALVCPPESVRPGPSSEPADRSSAAPPGRRPRRGRSWS